MPNDDRMMEKKGKSRKSIYNGGEQDRRREREDQMLRGRVI